MNNPYYVLMQTESHTCEAVRKIRRSFSTSDISLHGNVGEEGNLKYKNTILRMKVTEHSVLCSFFFLLTASSTNFRIMVLNYYEVCTG